MEILLAFGYGIVLAQQYTDKGKKITFIMSGWIHPLSEACSKVQDRATAKKKSEIVQTWKLLYQHSNTEWLNIQCMPTHNLEVYLIILLLPVVSEVMISLILVPLCKSSLYVNFFRLWLLKAALGAILAGKPGSSSRRI